MLALKRDRPVYLSYILDEVRKTKSRSCIDLGKANSHPPQPEPEEVENEPTV